MRKFWFTFGENHPLANYVQPVHAKTARDAKTAIYRFYSGFKKMETGDLNPCYGKMCMRTIAIKEGIIKVE